MMKHTVLTIMLMLMLAGCSSQQLQSGPALSGSPAAAILPQIGELDGLATGISRDGSGIGPAVDVSGSDYLIKSDNAQVMGNELNLLPQAGAISWGIWRVGKEGSLPREIELFLFAAPQQPAYYALADYATGRWETAPLTDVSQALLLSSANHSPQGFSYVAVIASGQTSLGIWGLTRVLDNGWSRTETGFNLLTYSAGSPLAAIMVEDHPAVAFFDNGEHLVYLRATEPLGETPSDWMEPVNVAVADGDWLDMQLINGQPAIVFHDEVKQELRYVRCETTTGMQATDWPEAVKVDEANAVHTPECSLAEVDGRPAIAYHGGNTELVYVRSSSIDGSGVGDWSNRLTIHSSTGLSAVNPSLKVVRGKPAVTFHDHGAARQYYLRASSSTGGKLTAWQSPPVLLDEGSQLQHTWSGLHVQDGRPMVMLRRPGGANPIYMYQSETGFGESAADWSIKTGFGTLPANGHFSSCVSGDRPFMAYTHQSGWGLEVQFGTPEQGNFSWLNEMADDSNLAILSTAAFDMDGQPAVFYVRGAGKPLMFARHDDFSDSVF